MAITTKGKFNVALDGQGFFLQGVPDRPAYVSAQAPVYGTRFASGDRDYNDLSQWWYLIQTDWSGGFKNTVSFEDDAKFYYSSNIDARTKPGSMRLEKSLALTRDNDVSGNDEVIQVMALTWGTSASTIDVYASSSSLKNLSSGFELYSSGEGTTHHYHIHRGYIWNIGSVVAYSQSTSSITPTAATSNINTVIDGSIDEAGAGVSVGNTLYVFGISTTNNIFCVKTAVAAPTTSGEWTLVFEIPIGNNLGASVVGASVLGSEIVFLVEGSPSWNLHSMNIATGIVTPLKDFDNADQIGIYYRGAKYIVKSPWGTLLVTVITENSTGFGSVWEYNGTSLTKVYEIDEAKSEFTPTSYEAVAFLRGGCTVFGDYAYWGNLVYNGEYFFNFVKTIDDDLLYPTTVLGHDGEKLYLADTEVVSSDDQTQIYEYNPIGTAYKTSGFLVLGQHDKLQSVDKLLHNVNLGFRPLLTGEEIEIYYSELPAPTPAIASWTLLGEATYTADGGTVTFKVLPFPEGINPKKVWFRIQLKGGGTTTPTLTDFTLEYLPIPDYRRQWVLNLNVGDELYRLDGSNETRTGREMAGFLENLWLKKEVFDYQDIEYATTLLNGSLTAIATTITVDDTSDFPEYGRLVIGSEEVFYTGKTTKTFTGCIRARQGTVAASHADNLAVSAGLFKAIITNYQRTIPILQKDKEIESVIQLSLRETGT